MKTLTVGRHIVLIDEEDYPLIANYSLSVGTQGYVVCAERRGQVETGRKWRKRWYLHNLILGKHAGYEIDHINGNKLDNRRENLRIATRHQNQVNRHKQSTRNKSRQRGVDWDRRKGTWRVQICVNRKRHFIGYFHDFDEATLARQYAELKYFGELCPLPGREFKEWGGMEC